MTAGRVQPFQVLQVRPRISGVRFGNLVSFDKVGRPVVDYPGNAHGPQTARTAASVTSHLLERAHASGGSLLLFFENDDPRRPLIFDVVMGDELDTRVEVAPLPARSQGTRKTRDKASHAPPASIGLAHIAEVRDNLVILDVRTDRTSRISARAAIPLRNLSDPVVVLTMPDGEAIVVAQVMSTVVIEPAGGDGAEVVVRGSKVRIEADVELLIRSGNCTLRLDAIGKIVTTADQIVSRARGANKVQGGSVQLN